MGVVGFITRIYHDARSSERRIRQCKTSKGNMSFIPKINLRIIASSWFYYKNVSRCTVI